MINIITIQYTCRKTIGILERAGSGDVAVKKQTE